MSSAATATAVARGRNAYRAVYLAAPLKFHTTLHAFTRNLPRHFISPWQKDPYAPHRHKWRVKKGKQRGKWGSVFGPLHGYAAEGWPEPALLGVGSLAQVASQAQAADVQSVEFWRQLAERARVLRDVLSAADLAVVLDALVSADYRHTDLMTLVSRELIDDVDKLSLVEVAVVANAYSHFNCWSEPLFVALARQSSRLLEERDEFDPRSISVLMKALAKLKHRDAELLRAVSAALAFSAQSMEFVDVSELLAAYAALDEPLQVDADFWKVSAEKVPGNRMASLCPALRALAWVDASQTALREALVAEIVKGLQSESPLQAAPVLKTALGLYNGQPADLQAGANGSLPSFAPARVPKQLFVSAQPYAEMTRTSAAPGVGPEESAVDWVQEDDSLVIDAGAPDALADEQEAEELKPRRWYNPIARRPFGAQSGRDFAPFNASEHFRRNRRGALVAEALHGLSQFWQHALRDAPAAQLAASARVLKISESEAALVEAAAPILRTSVQGLPAAHLASCAEVYALHALSCGKAVDKETISCLLQEAVRKLSNCNFEDIKRLHEASHAVGITDLYLERARFRRFPKALRNHLRDSAVKVHAKEHPSSGPSPVNGGATTKEPEAEAASCGQPVNGTSKAGS